MTTTTARHDPARTDAMTEAELRVRVERLARDLRWNLQHSPRRSPSGLPILVLHRPGRPGRTIWRALLTADGDLSPAQEKWIAALTKASGDVAVWRPADLLDGTIHTQLSKEPSA